MDIVYKINGVTLVPPASIRFLEEGTGFVEAAERGAVGVGGVIIDDPEQTLTITAWSDFTVDDMDAVPTRVFTGFIGPRDHSHDRLKKSAPGVRVHDCDIWDLNAALALNRLHSNSAKRPLETDIVRRDWLLGSEAWSGNIFDEGLCSDANPGTFLAADLRGSTGYDVMAEMAPSSVKNFWAYRDPTSGNRALFHDRDDSTEYASGSRISNDRDDTDSETFYPFMDAVLSRTPENQFGAVWYEAGNLPPIYVTSPSTIAAMGLTKAARYSTNRIARIATRDQAAIDWLNVRAEEEDTITVTIRMPSDKVNTILHGHRLEVKFVHLPGYESFRWTRVRRRHLTPESAGMWLVKLQLFVIGEPTDDAEVPGGVCDDDLLEGVTFTYDVIDNTDNGPGGGPIINNLAGLNDASSTDGAWMATGHVTAPNGTLVYTFKADLGSSQSVSAVTAGGYACGGWTFRVYHGASLGATTTQVAEVVFPDSSLVNLSWSAASARYWTFTMSHYHAGFSYLTGFGGSGNVGLNIFQLCEGAETPIAFTGDPIDNGGSTPAPDGTSDTFYATDANGIVTPYVDGTLIVLLDGIDIWEDVTETDPDTAEYQLAFVPHSDERVRTRFVAQ